MKKKQSVQQETHIDYKPGIDFTHIILPNS